MNAAVDSFISPTLKHLRESWWDDAFTGFLTETLRPRPGNRILDVGCGEGLAEVSIGRRHISQIELYGVDLALHKVVTAQRETAAHNQRVRFAAADACRLPFMDEAFDSIYCVAVLQYIRHVEQAVAEFARVIRRGGRVVAVEPDNSARYGYSSVAAGRRAFEASARFFSALAVARGDSTDSSIGPKLPRLFAQHRIEPLDVRLFPVSQAWLGLPADALWNDRRAATERALVESPADSVRALGAEALAALDRYHREAQTAGPAFVEIQHTMLFATVGQKLD